jgi:hypothetical protein
MFSNRNILICSGTVAALSMLLGLASQFVQTPWPEYYPAFALMGGGALLLFLTLVAARDPRMLSPLRYLLLALLALLLAAALLALKPIRWTLPHGQFVSLDEGTKPWPRA